MAKEQRSTKETKKPKADKDKVKTSESAYKRAQRGGLDTSNPFAKKS